MNKSELIKYLKKSNIKFDELEHKPFFTSNDYMVNSNLFKGSLTKNLFLKNKKKQFILFSCHINTTINLKKISKIIGGGNLSFANEKDLFVYLGVKPGSVSPFGLLRDKENRINFYFDKNLSNYEKINFHPLSNTHTLTLKTNDFINFLIENKKKVTIFDFENYSLINKESI